MNWDFLRSVSFYLNVLTVIVAVAIELFGFGSHEPAPWVDGVVVIAIIVINLLRQLFPSQKLPLGFTL